MKTWLVYPPFADPTQPYGSLPALKGYLAAQGMDAVVVDLNLAAAHRLLGRSHVQACAEKISDRFSQLNAQPRLSLGEQLEYLALAEARPAALRFLSAETLPLEIFGCSERFYDLNHYRRARDLAEDALCCTSALGFPYSFHFNRASHLAVPWGMELLEGYFNQRLSPLDALYREFVSDGHLQAGDLVGVSLTFVSQIPEAFYLIQLIRACAPGVVTVIGGSCLQQLLVHAPEEVRRWVVSVADMACLGEGEATLARLPAVLSELGPTADARARFELLSQVPNLLLLDPRDNRLHSGPRCATALKQMPPPDFSDLDLDRYLAPEPTLLFAPTRGCYWNRCSFCDYGLNRSGLHGYREMAPAQAAEQMAALARCYGVGHIYLSVDVLAPRFAETLARELLDRKASVRWSSDFRIDPHYSAECCRLMAQSGLRAAAFGVESGSDTMLKTMHKGISAAQIRTVNAHFHQAGIATAWMMFSDHPGESSAEAMETVRLVAAERSRVDQFILGCFGLTSGSDIAARPEQYGIQRLFYCKGDDFRLFPLFAMAHPAPAQKTDRVEQEVARLSANYYLDHYPWAGAISTHHSLLYILKFGQAIFRQMRLDTCDAAQRSSGRRGRWPKGLTVQPSHDLHRLGQARQRFMDKLWRSALALGPDGSAPLTLEFYTQALQKCGPMRPKANKR